MFNYYLNPRQKDNGTESGLILIYTTISHISIFKFLTLCKYKRLLLQ